MPRDGSARQRRRAARAGSGVKQDPWSQPVHTLGPLEVLDSEQIERIHEASLDVLRTIGMDFLHPDACAVLADHGAAVEDGGPRVRFDPDLVMEWVAHAPSTFQVHSRNPARTLDVGGRSMFYATVGSAPYASDLDSGRRVGTRAAFEDLVRLGQSFEVIHAMGGYPVEPQDLDPSIRHIEALASVVRLSDKVFNGYALGRERMIDAIEIARIARGIDLETMLAEPSLLTIVNTSSPLRLDGPMIEGMTEMARLGQVVCLTPFTLAGAMAPASVAGALVMQNAEALASIAFSQMIRKGAPMIYGGFTSNVDMKSGAPAFGTPEYTQAAIAGGQLARRYGLPYRTSNANAANVVDAQAAYESEMSLWGAVMGGGNMIQHGAGWMEGGLVADFEKFIVDVELLQMMSRVLTPLPTTDDDLALGAMEEVGTGGHFFGAAHTLDRYESAFYPPIVSDWQNHGAWLESGGERTDARANKVWKRVLADFEPPPLPDEREAELVDFVGRRVAEGGVRS